MACPVFNSDSTPVYTQSSNMLTYLDDFYNHIHLWLATMASLLLSLMDLAIYFVHKFSIHHWIILYKFKSSITPANCVGVQSYWLGDIIVAVTVAVVILLFRAQPNSEF